MNPVFERQLVHLLSLVVLLGVTWALADIDPVQQGSLWISTPTLLILAVGIAVVHQGYVWLVWRMELHRDWVTSRWPNYGFRAYTIGFIVIGSGRIVFIGWLAVANRGTVESFGSVRWLLGSVFLVASLYCFYSVHRYFGIDRAAGIDHFEPERDWPLVNDGIFRYTSNGMYSVGFLFLWVPGLLFGSAAALLAAAFQHAYIWVHYYCTERPDMREIYGEGSIEDRSSGLQGSDSSES